MTHPANPYLREYEAINPNWAGSWHDWMLTDDGRDLDALTISRNPMVWRYAWAIPSPEALELVAKHAPIVEVGAGTGYWAHLLEQMGVDVIAYDSNPPSEERWNGWHPDATTWTTVHTADAGVAAAKHPDRSLFICWPPREDPMAADALAAYEGDTVLYIGEWIGATCADIRFFELLDDEFEDVEGVLVPQWLGMNDRLLVFRRRNLSGSVT